MNRDVSSPSRHTIFSGNVEIPCKGYNNDSKNTQVHIIYGLGIYLNNNIIFIYRSKVQ